MAREDIYLNINASDPADAVVLAQQTLTAADFPTLVLGDAPLYNFRFTDGTANWPSWAGNASYSIEWALSAAASSATATPFASSSTGTIITGGWSVRLPLNTTALIDAMDGARVSQEYPIIRLWQHIRVLDSSDNAVSYAMIRTSLRYRAMV